MNDRNDDLLKRIGAHARERQAQDAMAPLPDEFQARVTELIQVELGAADSEDDSEPPRRSAWRAGLALAASVVAAVALALLLRPAADNSALPRYSLEMRGGATVRSADPSAAFEAGDRLDLLLRPAISVTGALEVAAYRFANGALQSIALPPPRWSDNGVARIVMTLDGGAPFPPGTHELVLVIGYAERMPDEAVVHAQIAADTPDGEGYRVLSTTVAVAQP